MRINACHKRLLLRKFTMHYVIWLEDGFYILAENDNLYIFQGEKHLLYLKLVLLLLYLECTLGMQKCISSMPWTFCEADMFNEIRWYIFLEMSKTSNTLYHLSAQTGNKFIIKHVLVLLMFQWLSSKFVGWLHSTNKTIVWLIK